MVKRCLTIALTTTSAVHLNSSQNKPMAAVYIPPNLPAYLTDQSDLKAVVGVPSDDEVKLIHTAIRTVESVSHGKQTGFIDLHRITDTRRNLVPALFDSGLSMDLAQHLFDVQMGEPN